MFDAFKVGEKWTTVIPSTIDVDFFDSVHTGEFKRFGEFQVLKVPFYAGS